MQMKHQPSGEIGFRIVVAIFALTGVVSLGFIPGIGILLLCAACSVGFFGSAVGWRVPRIPGIAVWVGMALSLLGIVVVATLEPSLGARILLVGVVVSIVAAVYQWFEAAWHR